MSTQPTRSRTLAGVPAGGEFAARSRTETATTLAPEKNWGHLDLEEGSRTPWGTADSVTVIAPGIAGVGTPSHGGYKLSPERNKAIPAALRNSNAWYEEDCEAYIVGWAFPTDTAAGDSAEQGVKNWFWQGYEKATGTVLAPGESREKDRATWLSAHASDLLTISASSSDEHPGMVEVTATRGGLRTAGDQAARRTFLVPQGEYRARGESTELGDDGTFVVDPTRYEDITKPAVPETPTARYTGIDSSNLTATGQRRLAKDLTHRYRHADGTVQSIAGMIEAGHMSGKRVSVEDGKRCYYLESRETHEASSSFSYKVAKTTWEAFSAPDERTGVDRARQDFAITEHALEKVSARSGSWRSVAETQKVTQARAAHRAAAAAYKTATDAAMDQAS